MNRILISWPALLLLVGLLNLPAVTGPFLFDDFPNLDGLISINEGTKTGLDFVLDGDAGPTGRPVALATFLWSSDSFPDKPLLFKIINLAIHLLNVLLVYVIATLILKEVGLSKSQASIAGLVAMLFWGVHPINQSAVFLVIQRMTLLMTFFSLASICVFLKYRPLLKAPLKSRSFLVVLVIGVLGVFSLFSKESGVILPILLFVIQATIFSQYKFSSQNGNQISKVVSWLVVYLPSFIVIVAFLYWVLFKTNPDFVNRDFTMLERLLTQPRVIVDYLFQIVIPQLSGSGLFHDDYQVSKSPWNPLSTILCVFVLFLALIIFVAKRRVWPVASFAVLFYFAGHLIESTALNLELYFEHRNYLPSIGLAILAGYGFVRLSKVYRLFMLVYIVLVSILGAYNAYTWGGLSRMAQSWANENPQSPRAQVFLANYYDRSGHFSESLKAIERAVSLAPLDGTKHLQLAVHQCFSQSTLENGSYELLTHNIKKSQKYSLGMSDAADVLVQMLQAKVCSGYAEIDLIDLYLSILHSGKLSGRASQYNLAFQISQLYGMKGDLLGYMNALENTYKIYPNLNLLNLQLSVLFENGLDNEIPFYIKRGRELIEKTRVSALAIEKFYAYKSLYEKKVPY